MRRHAKVAVAVMALLSTLAFGTATASAAQVYVPAQTFSGPGSDPGQLNSPRRAAIEQSTGNLFVADSGNGRVQVFDPEGNFLTSFGEAQLDEPFGLAIYESGGQTEVYVSDPGTEQIVRYDSDEQATPSFTVDPGFTSPPAGTGQLKVGDFAAPLAVDPTSGDLWVGDPADNRAQRYDSSGAFELANDGSDSPAGAFTGLLDLATDSAGRLYVVDANGTITGQPDGSSAEGQSQVERFSAGGAYQLTLNDLTRPATVATDLATDQVAVSADQDNVDYNGEPSLHVYDSSGTKLYDLRMGPATQYTTVHGLAWRSSDENIFSVNDVGFWGGGPNGSPSINRFELANEPTASIDPVASGSITGTEAEFTGTVNPGGKTTTARFELSSDGGSSWKQLEELPVCEVVSPGDCTGDEAVAFTATGLTPNVTYSVRLVAESSVAEIASTVESFTTDEEAPAAITDRAQRTSSSAVFNGRVNPYGLATTYYFEYGTSPGVYTTSVPASEDADAGAGTELASVSQEAAGLAPSTTYYYRLVAANAQGTTLGDEVAVTTLAAGQVMPDNYFEVGNFGEHLPGSGPGEFNEPRRLAVHEASGEIFVVDQVNNRVQVFEPTGNSANYLTEFGSGVLNSPFGIAIDQGTGDVYVSNGGSSEIVKFDRTEGNPPTFAPDPSFTSPPQGSGAGEIGSFSSAMDVDQSTGDLWVADSGNNRVQHFTSSGSFVGAFDGSSSPKGAFTTLSDIRIDSTGAVVVAREPYVERFSQSGKHQLTIGGEFFGGYVDGLNIAVNPFDQILVGTGYQDPRIDIWENGKQVGQVSGFIGDIWGWGGLAVNQQDGHLYALSARHFECCAINSVRVLVPGTRPVVTIDPVTDVGSTTAELEGSVNPQAQDTRWYFEYARAGSNDWYPAPYPFASGGNGSTPQPVSETLTNLDPNTDYEVRLVAINPAGKAVTAAESFSTSPGAPLVSNTFAAPRTTTTARLNARIDPNGEATSYYFEYGTDTDYGTSVPMGENGDAGSGDNPLLVSGEATGLEPGTEYHYRVVATNGAGATVGDDHTFATRTEAEMTPPARGIELVNQPEKGNQEPGGGDMTPDGDQVFWNLQTGAPGSPSAFSQFRSRRTKATPQWWESSSVLPPIDQLEPNTTYDTVLSVSEDGSRFLVRSHHGDGSQGTIRIEPDGSVDDLYTSPPDHLPGCQCISASMSKDGQRVFLQLTRSFADFKPVKPWMVLDPDHPQGTEQVYEIGDGTPELMSRLPDGTVPSCSSLFPVGPFEDNPGIDDAGDRVVFESLGADCAGPYRLYLRDLTTDTTVALGGAPVAGQAKQEEFIRISPDGSQVLFRTEARLDPADENDTGDIYRWTDADGAQCLTCVVAKADVIPGVVVSDDFSRMYFTSRRQLVPGEGVLGAPNLYVWREGEIDYVAAFEPGGGLNTNRYAVDLNPTGEVAVFLMPTANATTDESPGAAQLIRYDDRDGSLECVSCAPPGVVDREPGGPTRTSGLGLDSLGMLSDDGEDIAFRTTAPLLPADINNLSDIYVWHNGSLQLVTSGANEWPSDKLNFISMTPDASTILFSASARLTGYEKDAVGQLYVSRVGSDNPGPPTAAAPCVEDSCQGPLVTPPTPAQAGSRIFSGPENPKAQKPRKACGKGKRRVKVKGKVRCVPKKKGHAHRGNGNRGASK